MRHFYVFSTKVHTGTLVTSFKIKEATLIAYNLVDNSPPPFKFNIFN